FFFSSRRRHTRFSRDWSSDVCSSDLGAQRGPLQHHDTGHEGDFGAEPDGEHEQPEAAEHADEGAEDGATDTADHDAHQHGEKHEHDDADGSHDDEDERPDDERPHAAFDPAEK